MNQSEIRRRMDEAMDAVLVDVAASMLKEKLAKAREKGRGGWWNLQVCTVQGLRQSLEDHVDKGDPVDIMALAAMIAVREKLTTK